MSVRNSPARESVSRGRFYLDWIVANMIAEAIGIGAAALVAVQLTTTGTDIGAVHPLVLMLFVVLVGTLIEGVCVGLCQGFVIRKMIPVWKWTLFTAIGAGVAWILGMLPSTLMEIMGPQAGAAAASEAAPAMEEISQGLMLLMATGMGLVLGIFLAVPQWYVLSRHVIHRTWQWIPANMIAWAAGMLFIFASMDFMPLNLSLLMAGLWGAGIGAITGFIVGIIHGYVMRNLIIPEPPVDMSHSERVHA